MSDVNPARVVADADVLAADLFVDGDARAALDHVRRHSWVDLAASSHLLDDAEAVVASLADDALAGDWREKLESVAVLVDHPAGDQPALATAHASDAAHVLSFDETLRSAQTAAELDRRVDVSVKAPDAFARLFDPESLHAAVVGCDYPGPDRDPRA